MTSHMSPENLSADDFNLSPEEADNYEIVRIRNATFEAVHELWRKREAEGMRKQHVAEELKRDKAWVSRALRGPSNWEFKTFARLVRALRGEVEIKIHPIEDRDASENYHAYKDASWIGVPTSVKTNGDLTKSVSANVEMFVTKSFT